MTREPPASRSRLGCFLRRDTRREHPSPPWSPRKSTPRVATRADTRRTREASRRTSSTPRSTPPPPSTPRSRREHRHFEFRVRSTRFTPPRTTPRVRRLRSRARRDRRLAFEPVAKQTRITSSHARRSFAASRSRPSPTRKRRRVTIPGECLEEKPMERHVLTRRRTFPSRSRRRRRGTISCNRRVGYAIFFRVESGGIVRATRLRSSILRARRRRRRPRRSPRFKISTRSTARPSF